MDQFSRLSVSNFLVAPVYWPDLTIYDLLDPLLKQVPADERTGAIVKGQHRTYAKTFRKIARARGTGEAAGRGLNQSR
ncbi:hypothetical protein QA640_22585 [Bradyrhizobium sp. CB82]|uniref:hypothetical protein n=1 Tax=Bradyrhizobium sp. CB82 TaxID=3039159 RepID=UPI0024B1C64B|nr:hypothetical protein [Bradyrhizobium sp. CB82]WFU37284.1 hypothetical protein QA640_22585 [Bradyrhizobium sp. CB82]